MTGQVGVIEPSQRVRPGRAGTKRARNVVRSRPGRAFLSVRGVHRVGSEPLARAAERALRAVEGVHWAEVNPVLAQVAVAFEDGAVDVDDLAGVLDAVEDAHAVADDDLPADLPSHPADVGPIRRGLLGVAADAAGIGMGVVGRVARLPRLPVELASAVPAIDSFPPVRRLLEARPPVETAAAVLNAVLQGLGQGPVGLLVDAAHRVSTVAELTARRRAWLTVEHRLHAGPRAKPLAVVEVQARPVPRPGGVVDRYGQLSSMTSLAGSGLTLALTRNPRRTADVLLAGIPRAARLGRDAFASQLGRALAGREVVVMDPRVLRRLEQIDTVLLDAELASAPQPDGTRDDMAPALHELAGAVERAGHLLVIGGDRRLAAELGADREVAGGSHLATSVRALQADGRVVAVVSRHHRAALAASDCGIGVVGAPDVHPPWGAHLLCLHLDDAAAVVEGTRLARTACRQAVALAAAGSAAAGLFALRPVPGAGHRAMTAVQLASMVALGAGTYTATRLPPRPPRPEGRPVPWHTLEAGEVLRRLEEAPVVEVSGEPPSPHPAARLPELLLTELANPLSLVLGAGAALSAAAGSVVDAALIAGVLGVDAVVGAAQRMRTEAAIGRLASAVAEGTARVLREGTEVRTSSRALGVGDVVLLESGDAVPADCRLLDTAGLEVDESSLTGESLPVEKGPEPVAGDAPVAERSSMVYAGTAVAAGRARGVVVATGPATEARRGAAAAQRPRSGVETRLHSLTTRTVPIVVAAGAGLGLNGLLRGIPAREALASGVSLAAAAVPEGLPFVATVAQAAAARRLAAQGVLVRNPEVLEALGRVDVLCFDKTGTLTEGRLQLRVVSDGNGDEAVAELGPHGRRVLAAALRATPRPRGRALPHSTDQAVVEAAAGARVRRALGAPTWHATASLPFESSRGYHAVLGHDRAGARLSVKGAPEVVLPRCARWRRAAGVVVEMDDAASSQTEGEVARLAAQGLRVLAVAERHGNLLPGAVTDEHVDGLELLGFVGVADVSRPSASAPLEQLWEAGINLVMVTGDHPHTARTVAHELGLLNGRRVLGGAELAQLDDAGLDRVLGDVAVFARVTPADKVRIVRAFQRTGRVVAMTGDGANDAQAINLADIGVAFGPRATSAAREAADLVVTSDDLGALIDTLVEGRAMWASVRDALAILLGGNLGEVAFTTGAALATGRSPLGARQLLAVNLFTDLAPAMAIAVQPPRTRRVDLAREGPETSLAGHMARDVAVRATATAAGAYAAWLAARFTGTRRRASTVALAALVGSQLGQTLVIGRRSPLVAGTALVSSAGLVAIVQTPGLSHFFGCRPLGPLGWTIAAGASGLATAGAAAATIASSR